MYCTPVLRIIDVRLSVRNRPVLFFPGIVYQNAGAKKALMNSFGFGSPKNGYGHIQRTAIIS